MANAKHTKDKLSYTYCIANRAIIMGMVNVLNARSVTAREMIKDVRYSFRRLRDFSNAIITITFNVNPTIEKSDITRHVNTDSPVEYTQPVSLDRSVSFDNNEQYFSLL